MIESSVKYDIAIVGGGSAGLIAADFASQLGVRVALLEANRIGGDCTWTGCVPSKTVIRSAHVAHDIEHAIDFGIQAEPSSSDMRLIHERVNRIIGSIYEPTAPEALRRRGIDARIGPTRFLDGGSLQCGDERIEARRIIICTGAHAVVPDVPGLAGVPMLTYGELFDLETLPPSLIVLGGGPLGVEMAQAFARLGSRVTMVAPVILDREEPEAQALVTEILKRDGIEIIPERALEARRDGDRVELRTDLGWHGADRLLVAAGRAPNVDNMDLEKARVAYDADGIHVDRYLRTTMKHIYACGDVIGGPQFSHLAGYEGFRAVRNALLPWHSVGKANLLPAVTFTDPEVARVGPTESDARRQHHSGVDVHLRPMSKSDRARCEGETDGFIKILTLGKKKILGATIVGSRAGEMISEIALAMEQGLPIDAIAETIHAYPTWSTDVQLAAVEVMMQRMTSGWRGRTLRWLSRLG